MLNDSTENAERRTKLETINHHGLLFAHFERVIMRHLPKCSFKHAILKMIRTIKLRHLHAESLLHAEMPRFPSHFFSGTE